MLALKSIHYSQIICIFICKSSFTFYFTTPIFLTFYDLNNYFINKEIPCFLSNTLSK
ncbi:hypothetical protein BBUWI9123_E0022 (plasmid) [Borreliella burgdorferi WI91-23]|nr:hypothetical protein BBUWI9123_E0022 [Borreliella burgdorferi WI91-23]